MDGLGFGLGISIHSKRTDVLPSFSRILQLRSNRRKCDKRRDTELDTGL